MCSQNMQPHTTTEVKASLVGQTSNYEKLLHQHESPDQGNTLVQHECPIFHNPGAMSKAKALQTGRQ